MSKLMFAYVIFHIICSGINMFLSMFAEHPLYKYQGRAIRGHRGSKIIGQHKYFILIAICWLVICDWIFAPITLVYLIYRFKNYKGFVE